jgi:O-antigen/teichoic acid export membrane protein
MTQKADLPLSERSARLSVGNALRRGGARRDMSFTLLANVILMALGGLTGVLAARWLGPTGRGQLAAIQLWPALLGTIAVVGMPESLAYYAAKKPHLAGPYLTSAVLAALAVSVAIVAIGYVAMPLLLLAQSPIVVADARIYLAVVPLTVLVGLPFHVLRGTGRFAAWNVLRLLPTLAWLAVLLASFAIAARQADQLAFGYLAVLALLGVPIWFVVLALVPKPHGPHRRLVRPLLRFGLPSVGATLPQIVNLRADQLVIAIVLPPDQLGLYAAAVAWSSVVNPIPQSLAAVLLPRVAGEENAVRRGAVYAQWARIAWMAGAAIGLLVAMVTPLLFPILFGPRFQSAVLTAVVLVVAGSMLALNGVLEEGLRGLGAPRAAMLAEVAGVPVTLVALITLLPRLGILGAAIASLFGYVAIAIVLVYFSSRSVGGWRALLVPTRGDRLVLEAMSRRLVHRLLHGRQ